MYDNHLFGGSSWPFYGEIPFFCLMFNIITLFWSIDSVFSLLLVWKGQHFFHLIHGFNEKIFNRFSKCYIASTGTIVPRATALELPLLVLYGPALFYFFPFFNLSPGLKRRAFAVFSWLIQERELLTSEIHFNELKTPPTYPPELKTSHYT